MKVFKIVSLIIALAYLIYVFTVGISNIKSTVAIGIIILIFIYGIVDIIYYIKLKRSKNKWTHTL